MPRWPLAARPGLEVAHLLGEALGGVGRIRVERLRGVQVAARSPPDAEVDATGRQRLQHAELLGHLQGRVVREHHAGAADADARGAGRDGRHQQFRGRADDAREAVVLAEPEAVVAERLAERGEVEGVANRLGLGPAGDRGRLVEHREGEGHRRDSGRPRAGAPRAAGAALAPAGSRGRRRAGRRATG
jgi:hypothetical protein